MGMCPGVRRAIRIAAGVESPHDVTIFGQLVHNEQVLKEFANRGFLLHSESERGEAPATPQVLIPAHGISLSAKRKLRAARKRVIDATCPFVKRIQSSARALHKEGRYVVVIGKAHHVEVKGIVEDLEHYAVVAGPEEVTSYPSQRLGVLCQSTTPLAVAELVLARIQMQNPGANIVYFLTICPSTRERQAAVLDLLPRVDALVVAGGANSNNTLELVRLALSQGTPCFHVQCASDMRPEWFRGCNTVGLTAGASTPDAVIREVHSRLCTCPGAADIAARRLSAAPPGEYNQAPRTHPPRPRHRPFPQLHAPGTSP